MRYYFKVFFALLGTTFLTTPSANANNYPSTSKTPITVVADSLNYQGNKGTSTYRGNVEIEQEDTKLRGEIVTIYTNEEQQITKIIAVEENDKVAYYQERDKNNELLKAWGKTISYDINKQIVEINGNSKLIKKKNQLTGDYLPYNRNTDQVIATSFDETKKKERVKTFFLPE